MEFLNIKQRIIYTKEILSFYTFRYLEASNDLLLFIELLFLLLRILVLGIKIKGQYVELGKWELVESPKIGKILVYLTIPEDHPLFSTLERGIDDGKIYQITPEGIISELEIG